MTVKLLAIQSLKSIRDHLMTSGYPTHMIVSEIDEAIDAIHEHKDGKPKPESE